MCHNEDNEMPKLTYSTKSILCVPHFCSCWLGKSNKVSRKELCPCCAIGVTEKPRLTGCGLWRALCQRALAVDLPRRLPPISVHLILFIWSGQTRISPVYRRAVGVNTHTDTLEHDFFYSPIKKANAHKKRKEKKTAFKIQNSWLTLSSQ